MAKTAACNSICQEVNNLTCNYVPIVLFDNYLVSVFNDMCMFTFHLYFTMPLDRLYEV